MKTTPKSTKKHRSLRKKIIFPYHLLHTARPIKPSSKYSPSIEDAKHKEIKNV